MRDSGPPERAREWEAQMPDSSSGRRVMEGPEAQAAAVSAVTAGSATGTDIHGRPWHSDNLNGRLSVQYRTLRIPIKL